MSKQKRLDEAYSILVDLGMPRAQLNERSALCLLALVNITGTKTWADCESPLIGITPIMEWAGTHYDAEYAPNTRETFRRQTMHQFIEAGICRYNPDKPERPVNSPKAVYQIEPHLLEALKLHGTSHYAVELTKYKSTRKSLVEQYANVRAMEMIPVYVRDDYKIALSRACPEFCV